MAPKSFYILAELDQRTQKFFMDLDETLIKQGFVGLQTRNIPYHLTLGHYDLSMEAELSLRIKDAAGKFEAIPIHFSHIGLFGLQVLFLAPNMSEPLMRFHQHFPPSPFLDEPPWSAHATLRLGEPDEIQKAIPLVTARFEPFDGFICAVSLYEFFPPRMICRYEFN